MAKLEHFFYFLGLYAIFQLGNTFPNIFTWWNKTQSKRIQNFRFRFYPFLSFLLAAHTTWWKFFILWKFSLHIVCIFRLTWNFLTTFVTFIKKKLSRNIYTPILKFWDICTCATCDYSLLYTIYKSPDMGSFGYLHWAYPLINETCRCHH